ncbi:mRNA cleavage and polyadenylation specificity factor-like protein [Halegenticoccus soli]|uniref:mRNA cleavage and polyadenylation specificity factor-like protein n=1 Tax=Halegenticoccus soli TaxID=1985678 RepID=UPI000C6C8DD3|nr:mRNA cleavage and polyadenylation specificity factor-like protein [Halegenticoccus soli]
MLRLKDGIHFDLSRTIVADARGAVGDVNVVSHAHADHLLERASTGTVVCSAATAALAGARTGADVEFVEETDGILLLPAGHIVGSRAALIEEDGRRFLYTGDVSTRDRLSLRGFEPVPADELVVETTYGHPDYRFPDQRELEGRIVDWIADAEDRPLFLFGYSLGRAQEIQALAERATNRRLVAHGAVAKMNRVIESVSDRRFSAVPYAEVDELAPDDVFVVPTHLARNGWVNRLADRLGAAKVGFSGWAVDESFRYRGGYDETFVLSDHCDFDELVDLVGAVDPERVYTHHGFDETFASHLATEHGYEAYPLRRNQRTLGEF